MDQIKKGRQTPTTQVTLPYKKTRGQKAVDIYESTGRKAQEWQRLLLFDILAENEDGLWTHTKFGYSVPRRNGKNEIVAIREMYGFKKGERILHTAHRTTTSHSAWERLCELLTNANIEYKSYKQFGFESIYVKGGGKVNFRTRSSKGGLGEGYDLSTGGATKLIDELIRAIKRAWDRKKNRGPAKMEKEVDDIKSTTKLLATSVHQLEEVDKVILHDRIWNAYGVLKKEADITVEDKANIEYLYEQYKSLGGNHKAKIMFEEIKKKPVRDGEE